MLSHAHVVVGGFSLVSPLSVLMIWVVGDDGDLVSEVSHLTVFIWERYYFTIVLCRPVIQVKLIQVWTTSMMMRWTHHLTFFQSSDISMASVPPDKIENLKAECWDRYQIHASSSDSNMGSEPYHYRLYYVIYILWCALANPSDVFLRLQEILGAKSSPDDLNRKDASCNLHH